VCARACVCVRVSALAHCCARAVGDGRGDRPKFFEDVVGRRRRAEDAVELESLEACEKTATIRPAGDKGTDFGRR
jgi:hypothetical protein